MLLRVLGRDPLSLVYEELVTRNGTNPRLFKTTTTHTHVHPYARATTSEQMILEPKCPNGQG